MTTLADDLVAAWRTNHDILLKLAAAIPPRGYSAVPLESRGRTVAAQLFHLHRVREGWLQFHRTGKYPNSLEKFDKDAPPSKAELRRLLTASGRGVEAHLKGCFAGEATVRMFRGQPARWMVYLISHESHHRGQILLALKQNGMRMSDKVGLQGVWMPWFQKH
jgi:uncharacterized damage-inducible protein DinB